MNLTIKGLGPIEDRTIPTEGTITAPSESGKTTALTALCWALTGTDETGAAIGPEFVKDGADAAEVTLEGGGLPAPVSRRITSGGSKSQKVGDAKTSASGVASLVGLAGREELARVIMSPLLWRDLHNTKRGRPLADLIQSVLPPVDPKAEIGAILSESGHALSDGDNLDEKGAQEQQKRANARESEASGALEARQAVLTEMAPPTAPENDLDAAKRTIGQAQAAADAQAAHDRWADDVARLNETHGRDVADTERSNASALSAWEARCQSISDRHADAVARYEEDARTFEARTAEAKSADAARSERAAVLSAWETQRNTLGQRPSAPADTAGPLARAEAGAESARRALTQREDEGKAAKAALGSAQREAGHAATCPTCERPWDGAAARMLKGAEERVARARTAWAEAKVTADAAEARLASAREAHTAAEAQRAKVAEYDAKLAALGHAPPPAGPPASYPQAPVKPADAVLPEKPEPVALPEPPTLPAEPETWEGPPVEMVDAARATVKAWESYAALEAQYAQQRGAAEAAVRAAQDTLNAATAEAVRVRVLVAAVRAAPARIAEKQAEHLGDLGPVSLQWGATASDQAVEVLIDGRAFRRASTGRLRVADLYLRAALRRAAGLDWLPVVVDEAQAWSGEWPSLSGVLFLRTAAVEWQVAA